jgi:tetrahydromethanopterin S-methyltransferase subunit G
MTTDVTRGEFDHLKERVDVIEREVDGEKLVTRHILEQTRRNSDDLAAIKTRLDRVERKVDAVEQKVDGLGREVAGLGLQVGGLSRNLPTVVADVMREVLRERDAER